MKIKKDANILIVSSLLMLTVSLGIIVVDIVINQYKIAVTNKKMIERKDVIASQVDYLLFNVAKKLESTTYETNKDELENNYLPLDTTLLSQDDINSIKSNITEEKVSNFTILNNKTDNDIYLFPQVGHLKIQLDDKFYTYEYTMELIGNEVKINNVKIGTE